MQLNLDSTHFSPIVSKIYIEIVNALLLKAGIRDKRSLFVAFLTKTAISNVINILIPPIASC